MQADVDARGVAWKTAGGDCPPASEEFSSHPDRLRLAVGLKCLALCCVSVAAAVKWLTVPGLVHVTSGGAGPSLCFPLSPQRDGRCPRDEASVQGVTKELRLDTQRG